MTDRVTRAIQQEGLGFRAVAYNVPNTEHGVHIPFHQVTSSSRSTPTETTPLCQGSGAGSRVWQNQVFGHLLLAAWVR